MKYPIFFKRIIHGTKYFFNRIRNEDYIQLDWSRADNNFGDILNPFIISNISSKKILNVRSNYCKTVHMLAIGSVLDRATNMSVVWGSGFITAKSKCLSTPQRVCAVRGPLTRKLLIDSGVDCPEVYGDPALLLPRFYKCRKNKKYKLGIIPHYVDKNSNWLEKYKHEIRIIDVQNTNPLKVIDELCECENIASSSLHGLIVSDAYNIPSVWIKFSDKVVGGNFKFHDYFASINTSVENAIVITTDTTLDELIQNCNARVLNIDLNLLLENFPDDFK